LPDFIKLHNYILSEVRYTVKIHAVFVIIARPVVTGVVLFLVACL